MGTVQNSSEDAQQVHPIYSTPHTLLGWICVHACRCLLYSSLKHITNHMDDFGTCTSHCMEDLCRCTSCYKDGLTCNSHQKTAVQAALPAELAWETVGGVGYVQPTTVPTVVPVVARAATCAEWRRHGFHLVAKVTYSDWHDPLSLSIVCSHSTQVWLVKQWAGLCCLESNTACSLLLKNHCLYGVHVAQHYCTMISTISAVQIMGKAVSRSMCEAAWFYFEFGPKSGSSRASFLGDSACGHYCWWRPRMLCSVNWELRLLPLSCLYVGYLHRRPIQRTGLCNTFILLACMQSGTQVLRLDKAASAGPLFVYSCLFHYPSVQSSTWCCCESIRLPFACSYSTAWQWERSEGYVLSGLLSSGAYQGKFWLGQQDSSCSGVSQHNWLPDLLFGSCRVRPRFQQQCNGCVSQQPAQQLTPRPAHPLQHAAAAAKASSSRPNMLSRHSMLSR